jgi:hypothetical protein
LVSSRTTATARSAPHRLPPATATSGFSTMSTGSRASTHTACGSTAATTTPCRFGSAAHR